MASGKKGKKSKGKTLNLNEFLADDNVAPVSGQAVVMAPRKYSSWADEMENEDDSGMYESRKERVVLPTAPRSARSNDVDEDRVPHQPPFIAYMSNLPYDLEEPELYEFFEKLKIMKVRLPKDDREPGRLKGFGYVEFEERNDLKEALGMTDTSLKNRRIRIEVSDNDGGRRGGMRDREQSDRLLLTDWRSNTREEGGSAERGGDDRGGFSRRDYGSSGGFSRDRDGNRGGFTGDRGEPRSSGPWERNRGGPEPERSYERSGYDRGVDHGGYDRGGSDRGDRGGYDRGGSDRGDRGGYDRGGSDRGERGGFDRGGSDRGERGGYDRDRGFGNERYEGRGSASDRRGGGGYGGRRGYDDSRHEERTESAVPAERPKLNLAPRTKPLPEQQATQEDTQPTPAPAPVSSSAIFGGAKPVDTFTRELEIEERLAKQRAAPPPKSSEEGEGKDPDSAPASAPAPSWRSERQTSKVADERRDEPSSRKDRDSADNRYHAPRGGGGYQSRSGQSPSGRKDREGPRLSQNTRDTTRDDERASRPRGVEDHPPRKEDSSGDRSLRKAVAGDDVPPRMPKYEENRAPDFVQSNLYAALPDEDVECE